MERRAKGRKGIRKEGNTEGRKYGAYPCVDRFIELPGVGHCPMDEAPDLVNPLLLEFVNDYK